jgi:hypothetical protein
LGFCVDLFALLFASRQKVEKTEQDEMKQKQKEIELTKVKRLQLEAVSSSLK